MSKHLSLPRVEFYITNVCNLNCSNCNRLNNYKFAGHQYWKDYSDQYEQWSKILDVKEITILGGEPLLNPDLESWLYGIRSFWPDAKIDLATNGTRISLVKNLYKYLLDNNITLNVTLHNRSLYFEYRNSLSNFFEGEIEIAITNSLNAWPEIYKQVSDPQWPECTTMDDFDKLPEHIKKECYEIHKIAPDQYLEQTGSINYKDSNGVKASLCYYEHFVTAPLKYNNNNKFKVYNSDPIKAHGVCWSKYCHHFIKGKLYKCHHVALLPEFMEQYHVDINQDDLDLLNSYKPMMATDDLTELSKSVLSLRNHIPQCKLCPQNLDYIEFSASTEKLKIKKIINLTPI
jgi:organic radical activating enzyme